MKRLESPKRNKLNKFILNIFILIMEYKSENQLNRKLLLKMNLTNRLPTLPALFVLLWEAKVAVLLLMKLPLLTARKPRQERKMKRK